jgi:5-deoxy-5-amino-3-dehydroquinate synthase
VPLGDRSYQVVVGHGASRQIGELVPASARRAVVVTQPGVPLAAEVGEALASVDHIFETRTVQIGVGEAHKTMGTVEQLCRQFAQFGLTRNDLVVGLGGGMVTDVAGYAAASYHRGTPVLHVATTLLGMIDAAIGGKTGVNLPEGKNLVGAFWQPSGVICDLDALATLPEREQRCGAGEMAKYHFLTGDDLLALPMVDRVARCVEIKAEVVASDEREGGRRALLNYGHTLAHALEIATDHLIAHGEAVAVGVIFAARLAEVMGRITRERVDEHVRVVEQEYRLNGGVPPGLDHGHLVELMGRDKKALEGLTFVLDGPGGVEVVSGVHERDVLTALGEM